jgi:hypothetical protein
MSVSHVEAALMLLEADRAERKGFPGVARAKQDAAIRLLGESMTVRSQPVTDESLTQDIATVRAGLGYPKTHARAYVASEALDRIEAALAMHIAIADACVDRAVAAEDGLTERERKVLAWDKGPEEWYAEYGGQYGAELVDAQKKKEKT